MTFVLRCNKRLKILKMFYGKRFQPKQTEPKGAQLQSFERCWFELGIFPLRTILIDPFYRMIMFKILLASKVCKSIGRGEVTTRVWL